VIERLVLGYCSIPFIILLEDECDCDNICKVEVRVRVREFMSISVESNVFNAEEFGVTLTGDLGVFTRSQHGEEECPTC
jgi:hypothetical protein